MRASEDTNPGLLDAIANFFGVDPAFFGDDPAEVARAHEDVLRRALRDCGLSGFRICRGFAPSAVSRWGGFGWGLGLRTPSGVGAEAHASRDGVDSGRIWSSARTGSVNVSQMQALCQDLIAALGMRPPLDPVELCHRLGQHRGRRIKVRGVDLGATTSVGHVAQQRRVDSILYERAAPTPQRDLVIFHEVIHLVREHLNVGESLTCGIAASRATNAQGSYADWREWEAEVGARLLVTMSRQRPRPNDLPTGVGAAERSIAAAFGFVDRDQGRR
ncbi:hypothetical protein [Saccharopolyspora hattusasensis]|uniref:hypothetical protein n=1 Tax=Saccharopolyspora hattusasensis TaxID=1128679 RepID=UPI003D986A6C